MDLVGDERAQSIQIGAVLLFAVLIIAFSTYQAFAVPNQNAEVEFNHNQDVQTQIQDLRNAIVSVPGATSTQAVRVQLGTQYPSRAIAQNPGPPSGTLRTDGTADSDHNVTIRNAQASGETGDYWTGTTPKRFNSGTLEYSPNYNVYGEAPTTYYEHSLAYNQFRSENITLSDQNLVSGREITLVTLNGSLSRTSSGTTSVDVEPVSQSSRTVSVTDDGTNNVSVSFLSRLPASAWNDTLSEEVDSSPGNGDDDRYIADVSDQPGPGPYYNVTLTFERGVNYRLQMAKAGVGTRVSDENATYITNNTPTSVSITTSETVDLVVEARDDYNNPVADRTVYADVAGSSRQVATDEDGQATISVDGSALGTGTYTVETSLTSIGGDYDLDGQRNVSFTVDVSSSSGGGGGSGSAYSLNWDNPTADNPNAELSDCSTTGCTWNVGASSDDTLTLRSGTMPALGGFDVEYAVDNTTVGAVSPTDDATGPDGESTTDFTASENGTAAIYAASGGSSDLFNLTVENVSADGGGGGSTQTLEYQRLNKGDSGVAYFDIENTGSQVTVTDVAVDWSGSGSKTIDNSDSPEISIRPDSGQTGEANNGPYDANGDNIQLTPDAVIDSGTAAEVDIRVIEQGNSAENFDLQQVDSADQADLTIVLTLDGETDQVYYFEDTS